MYLKHCFAGGLAAAMLAVPACAFANQSEQWQRTHEEAAVAQPLARAGAPGGIAPTAAGGGAPGMAAGAAQPAAAGELPGLGPAADQGQLDGARGGTGVTSEATLGGAVSGNSATQVATGNNVIQSGSFANSSGLPVVIQNSGANVLIQNATIINLQVK